METEKSGTIDMLKVAIKMEIDGKKFYLKESRASTNEVGKRLLKSLAAEEDLHRQKFQEIYDSICGEKDCPLPTIESGRGKHLRTIFSEAINKVGKDLKAPASEIEAVATALDKESQSYDFYTGQADRAVIEGEKEFYKALAAQEHEHHRLLLDYYELLKDPAAWFVVKEHPSLDGG